MAETVSDFMVQRLYEWRFIGSMVTRGTASMASWAHWRAPGSYPGSAPGDGGLHGLRPCEICGGGGDLPRDLGMMSGRTWRCVLGAPGFGREHARKSDPM